MEIKTLRRALATVLLIGGLSLAVTGLVLLREISANSENFSQLYEVILLINSAGVIILMILIGANLFRLQRDYRNNIPGARLKARLVTAFVLLVVAPMSVVYLYSVQFLNEGIDSWFDVEVQRGLDDALDLSRKAVDLRMRDNLNRTRALADVIYNVADSEIYSYLPQLRSDAGAQEVSVFAGGSRIIATSSADPTNSLPLLPTDEVLLSLRRDNFYVALEPRLDNDYLVRTAVKLPGRSGREIRILQALFPLGKGLAPLATSVEETVARYTEIAYLREPLKSSFVLTLSIVVLVSLLIAVYVAFLVARRMIAPVQSLVAGTRAVAKGDLDTRLPSGGRDEIGFLVDSFNDMIEQLSSARAEAIRSESQVESERASVEAILARLSSGVIALEMNLTIRMVNRAAESLLNQSFQDCEGLSLSRLADGNPPLKQIFDILKKHLDNDETEWRQKVRLQFDDGSRVVVCACTALPGSYRSRSGYVVVFDDVTELLQAQREAAWGEVARRLAHEIKNPLTPIQLSAEQLRRKCLGVVDEASGKLLDRATQTIVQQVEAMRDMVDAFSDYARAPEMNRTNLDLNALIRQVADLYPAQQNQPAVLLSLAKDLPETGADAVRVRQVMHNLIRNALEAMEGQADAEVLVKTQLVTASKGERILISVTDNGPGLPAADKEKIFEPYVTTKSKGTGLGLAIVKKLIDEHGGDIVIESEVGKGTTVEIYLPVVAVAPGSTPVSGGDSNRRQRA